MSNLHIYRQELLRKYIDGTISADERHELEKMALDDDILFATLEGYSQSTKTDHKATLNNLHEELSTTRSKRRIIPLAWVSAAAGLVLIAAIGFLIRQDQFSTSSPMEKSISMKSAVMEEEVIEETEILADATTLQSPQNQKDYVYDEVEPRDITFDQEMDLQVNKTKAAIENEAYANEGTSTIAQGDANFTSKVLPTIAEGDFIEKMEVVPALSDQELANTPSREVIPHEEIRTLPTKSISEIAATSAGLSTSEENDDVSIRGSRGDATNYYVDGIRVSQTPLPAEEELALGVLTEEDLRKPLNPRAARKKAKSINDTSLSRILRGKVTDETNQGLIGVNVFIENTDIGTLTDIDGNFELSVPNADIVLNLSYVGYEDLAYPFFPTEQPLSIQMKESSTLLDEVVIAGHSTPLIKNAAPLLGYQELENYINANFVKHDNCTRSSVILSFTITEYGDVTDITNPIKDECFYEAKRLLQNAGKWKTMPARRRMVVEYEVMMMN